ncbi:MAG TPA: hypothetical protein VF615_19070 [Longimicrobiaceae bacterium]|jgi:hypothetical protein
MRDWPFWIAAGALLLSGGFRLYLAFRAGSGAALAEAGRLRGRARIASGSAEALYGAAILYHPSGGPARFEVFIAASVVFTVLALAGIHFGQRARELEAREASA